MLPISLPFKVPRTGSEGLARVSNTELSLEFEGDLIGGLLDVFFVASATPLIALDPEGGKELLDDMDRTKPIVIPLAEIESVSLNDGWLRTSVRVRSKSLSFLRRAPGSHRGEIELQVSRSDKDLARRFVSFLETQISKY